MFTLTEMNLILMYNTGSRMGIIERLTEFMKYLPEDGTELRFIALAVINKLQAMTDKSFALLNLPSQTIESA